MHPEGARYIASLFTYCGRKYLLGVSTAHGKDTGRGKTFEWIVYDIESRQGQVQPFAMEGLNPPSLSGSLLYGSVTRNNLGDFYVVGAVWGTGRPLVLHVHCPL